MKKKYLKPSIRIIKLDGNAAFLKNSGNEKTEEEDAWADGKKNDFFDFEEGATEEDAFTPVGGNAIQNLWDD